nr:protein MOR1 [Ipomoea batatas]
MFVKGFSGVSLYKPSGFLLLPIGLALGYSQEFLTPTPSQESPAFFVHQRSSPTAGVILRTAADPSLSRRPRLPPSSLPGVLHTVEVALRFHRIPQVSKVVLPHVFWCEDAVPETAGSGPSEELAADIPQEYELVDPVDILTPLEKSGFREGVIGSLLLSIVLFSNF